MRNTISVGGDSNTLAAIACSIAEAYYGVPDDLRKQAESYLDNDRYRPVYNWLKNFESAFKKITLFKKLQLETN